MTYEELAEQLVKVMDSLDRLLRGELKKTRQTGPSIGQTYWYGCVGTPGFAAKNSSVYPEERFAERKAKQLIQAVNKRRRELNEGKEFGDCQYYIGLIDSSDLVIWERSNLAGARGDAYPFGLFKTSADCETCLREFEDDLKWFYGEYLPLMEELDDYDWAEAHGWGEEV